MVTRRKTDRERAQLRAEKAFVAYVFGSGRNEANLALRAERHLTILAHWDGDTDGSECTCAQCWPWHQG